MVDTGLSRRCGGRGTGVLVGYEVYRNPFLIEMKPIRKAVIPAAGFGTRLLPATKTVPKEMLPIIDTPVIQLVVEEAVEAGCEEILIIVSRGKSALEDYFDRAFELEAVLQNKGKTDFLEAIRRPAQLAKITFIRQQEMRGLGDAVLLAREFVGDEPFLLLLGDTIVRSDDGLSVARLLVDTYAANQGAVIAVEPVAREFISRYGIVDGAPVPGQTDVFRLNTLIEKPEPEEAPSNLAVCSRYLLTPDVFDYLAETKPGKNGEIQITDALRQSALARPMFARQIHGHRYDAGSKLGYVKANVLLGLQRPDMREQLASFIKELAQTL